MQLKTTLIHNWTLTQLLGCMCKLTTSDCISSSKLCIICMYICICMCIYISHVCMHVHSYVCIYNSTYIHTHIYIIAILLLYMYNMQCSHQNAYIAIYVTVLYIVLDLLWLWSNPVHELCSDADGVCSCFSLVHHKAVVLSLPMAFVSVSS